MSILRVIFGLSLIAGLFLPSTAQALEGTTIDFAWDGGSHPNKAWHGRAYVPAGIDPDAPMPTLVFLHGLNKLLVKHRWLGGGPEDDLRERLDAWVAAGDLPPMLLIAPSSTVKSEVFRGASWRGFDLDHFVRIARRALNGYGTMDRDRVILAGHSGAGCSMHGGLATATAAQTPLFAMLVIDTCMNAAFGERMAEAARSTHVVVGYQKLGWTREFKGFERAFRATAKKSPPEPGVLRELHEQKPARDYHNATVPLTLTRWIPSILAIQ